MCCYWKHARDCDKDLCIWEQEFLLASRSQLLVQHAAGWPWHTIQQGHKNPHACSNRQQHQVWQPLPRYQAVLYWLTTRVLFSEIAIKALVTAGSQFNIRQWSQVEKEEFRIMLFFSYFEDKYVESKDSWKTEIKRKQATEHWLLEKWKFQSASELAYPVEQDWSINIHL